MEMKQVYEALEKVENGADLIAAIKGEINTLNNEAKKHRTAGGTVNSFAQISSDILAEV